MNIRVVGIDVGKTVFHVVGMDGHGKVILKNRLSRPQLLKRLVNLPPCLIGMEASCGAHYLARSLSKFGHDVRLIPAQFVRPFVKSQKNDYVDAEAIAEAVQRPTMRFVPVKTEDQLDLQALHRVRDRLMERRTSVINQIRAFLLERGLALRAGSNHLRTNLPAVLAAAEQNMSPRIYQLLCLVAEEWHSIEQQIERLDREIETIATSDEACRRLLTVPGIGPLIATAMVAVWAMGARSAGGGSLPHGSALFPDSIRQAAKPDCSASANMATNTSAGYSSTAGDRSSTGYRVRSTASARGSLSLNSAQTRISLGSRWPTSSRGSHGLC